MSETVLVTGAAGLLGAACVHALLRRGSRVVAVVRDRDARSPLYQEGLIDRCVEVRAELADAERLLAAYQPDAVLHLAAQSQVPVANADPLSTFEANLRGTWLLLEACRRAARPPARVLVASSDKAYGRAPLPWREDTPLDPVWPYDVSKAGADLLARSYAQSFGLPVVVTRCGNLYGPGDLNFRRLVPGLSADLLAGRALVLRSSGAMTRQWLHVEDAAAAALLVLDQAAALRGQAVNAAGEERASVREVTERLAAAARAVGVAAGPVRTAPDPPGEIVHMALDCARLRSLGWAPRWDLERGLVQTFAWYRAILG